MKSPHWFPKMKFLNISKSHRLFSFLKKYSPDLYGHLDSTKRTLFLRVTGDNFRAACKYTTEQMSFSVLNVEELLHSPYGQFISFLWRGCEHRENLIRHGSKFYHQLKGLLINGAELTLPNGEREEMNVIPIMCADLGYMKEILGKCLSTSKYGCYYCKKPLKEWDS